jgi:hypothetical protein
MNATMDPQIADSAMLRNLAGLIPQGGLELAFEPPQGCLQFIAHRTAYDRSPFVEDDLPALGTRLRGALRFSFIGGEFV